MRIGVLGTGAVGRAVAGRSAELGHEVVLGTRDAEATARREEVAGWLAEHPGVRVAPFAEAADHGELVVNAAGGDVSLAVLEAAGAERLAGKVLLDISNPLDHSQGFPPRLFVKDDDSLAERIQRAFPAARVVKALNTVNNAVMVDPGRLGRSTTIFVSGDDAEAKAVVADLLASFGHDDVLDLGGLETARGTEMWLPLWIRIALATGSSEFGIKVVRRPGPEG